MSSILDVAKLLGFSSLMRMRRARKEVWDELLAPHFVVRSMQTVINVGLLDAMISGPVDVEEFAQKNNLNAKLLLAICDSLYARRFMTKSGKRFGLDEKGHLIAETNVARGWFDLVHGYEEVLFRMEDLVRNKISYGNEVVREGKAVGVGSGRASVDFFFPLLRQAILRGGYHRVLDIGCGDGAFLRYLCTTAPGVEGVGIDLSEAAVTEGRRAAREKGLNGQLKLHVGNALNIGALKQELAGVDAATTFFVMHELCDGKDNPMALQFLRSYREALPGVPFHIVEPVRPTVEEMRQHPGPAVEYFLFHDLSGQIPISRESWKELFVKAGYSSADEDYINLTKSAVFTLRSQPN